MITMQQQTLKDLPERTIKIETQAERIFRELERRFSRYPESALLWKALATGDGVHARVLKKVLESASQETLAAQPPADVWDDVSAILNLMHQDLHGAVKALNDA
jgi:hypothetical protein